MSRRLVVALAIAMRLGFFGASDAAAQSSPRPAPASGAAAEVSRLWLTAGTTFGSVRGDCQTCEEDFPYRRSGGLLANAGYRANDRMDVGGEVFWMPVDSIEGQINTTHIDAIAQFRPWAAHGFFIKGGAGLAIVRNWVDAIGAGSINQKALSVVIGAGWHFRPAARLGFQVFGSQHVAALGDLQTAAANVPDVVGNYWSLGAAIVIR